VAQVLELATTQNEVPASKLRGEFIFLPSNGHYHWLVEDLPVFLKSVAVLRRRRGLFREMLPPYAREMTGLIDNDIVYLGSPAWVERLVMTAKTADMGSPLAGLTPHPVDVGILREFFSKYHEPRSYDCKLYLSRAGHARSPANER